MPNIPYVLHTTYSTVKNQDGSIEDFLFTTIKNSDNPDETVIKLVKDTTMPFWITKPEFRNHTHKKETAKLTELDIYRARCAEIPKKIAEVLGHPASKYVRMKDVAQSPYVYGADIGFDFIYKTRNLLGIERLAKDDPTVLLEIPDQWLKKGALDIEQSTLGGEEIIAITFIDDKDNVYTTVYEPFLKGMTKDELYAHCIKVLAEKVTDYNLKINLYIAKREGDQFGWIFDKIHKSGVDFVATWNMDYDVPTMIERMYKCNVDPVKLFNHPSIPPKYRVLNYRQDRRPMELVGHITEKWHWCDHIAKFRFYDAMALYSRNRKTETKLLSYKLGAILQREEIPTKLFADEETTHYLMQTTRFPDYVAYNIWDAAGTKALEMKVKDIHAMVGLCGANPFALYHKTTTLGEQDYYQASVLNGRCTATVVGSIESEFDCLIPKRGATVLDPNRTINTGCFLFEDYLQRCNICVSVSDIDARSMYPYLTMLLNASKDTNTMTVVAINDNSDIVDDFMTHYVATEENALYLLSTYFNTPKLSELVYAYDQYRKEVVSHGR
jgi:hypothetical protein